jgi:drug/metabolite transporter (DMT)-like permease
VSREKETDPSKGYAAVFATVFLWSTPSLFQFYLLRYYEPWSQNFYRYSIAFLTILPFVFLRRHRAGQPLGWNALALCLPACLPNVVHQVTQVMALFYMGPGVYAIFNRSSVIITALLALAFFPEERWIIRQWRFQAGTLLGFVGAIGVIAFQPGWQSGHFDWRGLLIAFIATFCWALYGVLVKRPSARLGSVRSFGAVSFLTSLMLLPLTVAFGRIATPLQVGAHVNLILVISAVLCISIAHVLYYIAIREIGVALSQTLQLLCPVGALILSVLIFHERLTHAQLGSAALLLFGAFLAMRVRPAATATTAENL